MNRSRSGLKWTMWVALVGWTVLLRAQPDPRMRIQLVNATPVGDSMQVTLRVQIPFPQEALPPGILEDGKPLRYRLDFSVWNESKELLMLKHFSRSFPFTPGWVDTVTIQLWLPRGRFYLSCYPMNLPFYIIPIRMQPLDLTRWENPVSSQKIFLKGNFYPFKKCIFMPDTG